ncbi:MAG: hypothetical protein CMJ46_16635 [Planctomyces sp.]|nr:hypothetical protein [Planctomyces sp.]
MVIGGVLSIWYKNVVDRQEIREARMTELFEQPGFRMTLDSELPYWASYAWTRPLFYLLPIRFQVAWTDIIPKSLDVGSDAQMRDAAGLFDLDEITAFRVRGRETSDATLAYVREMPKLEKLYLDSIALKDVDLEVLSQCALLKEVEVTSGKELDGAGLKYLNRLPNLKKVKLVSPIYPDDAWNFVAANPEVEVDYRISNSGRFRITDEHMHKLTAPITWERDVADQLRISDDSVEQFAYWRSLKIADLTNSEITNRGVRRMARWLDMEELNLTNTAVTDEVISLLAEEQNLRVLSLRKTGITDDALKSLAESP